MTSPQDLSLLFSSKNTADKMLKGTSVSETQKYIGGQSLQVGTFLGQVIFQEKTIGTQSLQTT